MDGENQNPNNANSGAENPKGAEQSKPEKVNYEELIKTDKELQSFLDSRISSSNKTAIENAKKQWKLELDTEKTEAEKLANMNEKQKAEYELNKAKKETENALAELNAYKLKEEAGKIASEKGLDHSLLNLIDFKTITAEKLTENIDNLSAVFNKAVEKAVNEKLREDSPTSKLGDTTTKKRVSRSSF